MNKDLQRVGLTWEEVEASAQDRQTWRQRVALCIGDAGSGQVKHSLSSPYCRIGLNNCNLFKMVFTKKLPDTRHLSYERQHHIGVVGN